MGRRRRRTASTVASNSFCPVLQLHRKLHDQDRVLRRQTHRGQQADLEVHVVGQARV
jgi:hypothetical protein